MLFSIEVRGKMLDHQSCRERTCLLCLKKAKTKRALTDRVKDLIQKYALPIYKNYSELICLPKVICETCRQKLEKRDKGKNVTITVPILSKLLENEMLPTGKLECHNVYFLNY